jgi:DNA-directed RNA polymerase specialized sigma24 family protein
LLVPDELDERSLVEAAQAEPARFLDLYDRHFHRVYAYVVRRSGSRAEDVTSEVFHRACQSEEVRVARRSVCGVALPNCGERACRPSEAGGA